MLIPWSQVLRDARNGVLAPSTFGELTFNLDPENHPGHLMLVVRRGQLGIRFHQAIIRIESPTHLKLLVERAMERMEPKDPE